MWKPINADKVLDIGCFYTAFEGEYNKSYIFRGETHNFWEMVYVEEGSLSVCADDRIYNVGKNELIFHKPMELHKFNITGGENAKLFIMSFELTGRIQDNFKDKIFSLTNDAQLMLMNIKKLMQNTASDLMPYNNSGMKVFSFISALDYPTIFQLVKNSLENFMITICNDGVVTENIETDPDAVIFSSAVRCMSSNLSNWLTISEIAQECGVSLTYLKNIFSKYAGMGIHKYYLNIKIQQAADLLKAGESVTVIADKLNFSSQNYFSIVFKRETGVSPTDYKRRTQNQ